MKPVNHALNAASTCACVEQEPAVEGGGQLNWIAGQPVTVKLDEHVRVASQDDVTVRVTFVVPPHAGGATGEPVEGTRLQPPDEVKPVNHVLNAASTCACVKQVFADPGAGQFQTTAGAFVTVKLEEHVRVASQVEVTV